MAQPPEGSHRQQPSTSTSSSSSSSGRSTQGTGNDTGAGAGSCTRDVASPVSEMMLMIDTNISPNPVVVVAHPSSSNNNNDTATTITTKRVEFNFVPSMMMFDCSDNNSTTANTTMDDDSPPINTNENHHHDNDRATTNSTGGGGGGAVLWDTETDHMLSYFLSGGDHGPTTTTSTTSTIDFTTMPISSVPISSTPTTAVAGGGGGGGNIGRTNDTNNYLPPPTPAVQFYSNRTPISSNVVFRSKAPTSNETAAVVPPKATNGRNGQSLQQQQHSLYDLYPNATANMTGSTVTTTQSQSSSSSSLSSLPTTTSNNNNIQMFHQQLQMQRMFAGSGGGNSSSTLSHAPSYLPTTTAQQQPPPNTLLPVYPPQMLLYPPTVMSHGHGSDQLQQQHPMQLCDGESPLSPATMIGTPSQHENLFLPRSNSFYENAARKSQSNENIVDMTMGPPVSRQPSINDIQSAMATAAASGYVWPPPGTATTLQNMTIIPTLPFNMMTPFLASTLSSAQDPAAINNAGTSSLLPNLQPFIYTTATMQQQQRQSAYSTGTIQSSSQSPQQQSNQQPITEEESEEKRNKRLERNRESARKCRLKKKERLHSIGIQVTELHKNIEQERRTVINKIVPILMQSCRQEEILNCVTSPSFQTLIDHSFVVNRSTGSYRNPITEIILGSGPSSTIMRSVLDFQYSTLKDITLPHYQKLLLWFTAQKESYYTLGKEQYYYEQQRKIKQLNSIASNKEIEDNANQSDTTTSSTSSSATHLTGYITVPRPNVIKISSKQVGEELMTGCSSSNSNTGSKDDNASKKRSTDKNQGSTGSSTNGGISSSVVYDGAKTWPLLCYELKLSVDQEERFIGKYKQILLDDDRQVQSNMNATSMSAYRSLSYIREEMAVAVTTVENLGKAVGVLSHMIAQRDENTYINVLHPQQVSKYYLWLSVHRQKARGAISVTESNYARLDAAESIVSSRVSSESSIDVAPGLSQLPVHLDSTGTVTVGTGIPIQGDSKSLHSISRRLSEVLQISSRQQHGPTTDISMNSI